MQGTTQTSSGGLYAEGHEGVGGDSNGSMRLKKGQGDVETPATVGDKGVRGHGSQGVVVGTGTNLPQSVVVAPTLLQRAMQRWVSVCILQRSPQVQALVSPLYLVT